MKHFIKVNNSTFRTSNSLANAITKSNLNFQTKIQNGKQIYILTESDSLLLQFVPTVSQTHFYMIFSKKKYRINKDLFNFLNLNCSISNYRNKSDPVDTKQLCQYFTKNADYILDGLSIPNNESVIEPFCGNGDLVSWSLKFQPKNIKCYDKQPKHHWIVAQDTLITPPSYNDHFVVTNPPFLSKAKAVNKNIFNLYQLRDLYLCFLNNLINSGCLGGVIILPANFWFSECNLLLRKKFLSKFQIKRINFFEEQVFDNARVTICSFDFCLKDEREKPTSVFIYPQKEFFSVNFSNCLLVDLEASFKSDTSIKICKSTTKEGKKLKQTALILQNFDKSKNEKIALLFGNEQISNKDKIRISTNLSLCHHKQRIIAREFNVLLGSLRKSHSSLLFPYFLSCNFVGFNRKKIPLKFAFLMINHIIKTKLSLQI